MAAPNIHPPALLTRREAAEYLRVSLATLDFHIQDGSLRSYQLGRKVMLDPKDLRKLLVPRGGSKS